MSSYLYLIPSYYKNENLFNVRTMGFVESHLGCDCLFCIQDYPQEAENVIDGAGFDYIKSKTISDLSILNIINNKKMLFEKVKKSFRNYDYYILLDDNTIGNVNNIIFDKNKITTIKYNKNHDGKFSTNKLNVPSTNLGYVIPNSLMNVMCSCYKYWATYVDDYIIPLMYYITGTELEIYYTNKVFEVGMGSVNRTISQANIIKCYELMKETNHPYNEYVTYRNGPKFSLSAISKHVENKFMSPKDKIKFLIDEVGNG